MTWPICRGILCLPVSCSLMLGSFCNCALPLSSPTGRWLKWPFLLCRWLPTSCKMLEGLTCLGRLHLQRCPAPVSLA